MMPNHGEIMAELKAMRADITELKIGVAATKEVVEAYVTVKNGAKFLKFMGGIGGTLAAAWLFIKTGFLHAIGGIRG